jgi:hypothetical protein
MEQEIDAVHGHAVFAHLKSYFKEQFNNVVERERHLMQMLEGSEDCWEKLKSITSSVRGKAKMMHSLETVYVFGSNCKH